MPKVMIDSWASGLWVAGPPSKNPPGTLTRMKNVLVQDEGTVATRSGASRSLLLPNTEDGIWIASRHFFKVGSTIYDENGVNLGIAQPGRRIRAAAMATSGVYDDMVFFPYAMKKVYFSTVTVIHGNLPTQYSTSHVSNWGIVSAAPDIPTAVDSGVAGNLTGDYTYKTAFYASATHTLGVLSDVSISVNVTAKKVTVGNLPATCLDAQVDTVNIYRSQGGITGAWFFVDSVTLGTATYTDNISDVGLGDVINNAMTGPPACNIAGRYKNTMLALNLLAQPRYVYPSLPSQPESFTSINFELLMDAGDTAQAVVEMGDYAVVFGDRGIYFYQQDQSGLIYTSKAVSGKGTKNGNTVSMGDAGIYFLSDDGVYVLSGMNVVKVSDNIDALFRGVDRGGLSTIADYAQTDGNFIGGRYYLTYLGTDGDWHTVVFNEKKQRWKHYTGWQYTVAPTTGSLPMIGLTQSVAQHDWNLLTDDGTVFDSELGFNLPSSMTALMDIRYFRVGLQSAGTVTVSFYDNQTLMYSIDLVAPSYNYSYRKHSLPLGTYFMQPEVRFSSSSPFTLKMFEADIDYVRKYEADYTRNFAQNTPTAQGQT